MAPSKPDAAMERLERVFPDLPFRHRSEAAGRTAHEGADTIPRPSTALA